MKPSPPNLSLPAAPHRQPLLDTLLAAHKAGRLDELLAQHPRAARVLSRRWLKTVSATAGDALPAADRSAAALTLLLRWALAQLRPDQAPTLQNIERSAWLDRTSWRPLLALMCQHGFEPVPPFRDHYHARSDEAPAEVLCGLWSVGASTFYRYLEKGKRQCAEILKQPPTGARATALRELVQQEVDRLTPGADEAHKSTWHKQQAAAAASSGDHASAMWHFLQAHDAAGFVHLLQRAHVALANDSETDGLCARLEAERSLSARQRVDFCLAQAALWRVRKVHERESLAYEQALQIAVRENDALMMGIVYGALGKFHEPRDADRAFACYEDSAECLRRASAPGVGALADAVATEYTSTLVRLAWLHVLRNDPRSRTVLDRAQQLRQEREPPPEVLAMLEQTWGEYWRRAGEFRRALEHKHRALNLCERAGDQRSVLATYVNLSIIYCELKEFDRAVDYARRVLRVAEEVTLEPEMLCSVHLNLGMTYFWQERYDLAITQYQAALERSESAGLSLHTWRAHYNLAEAYYKRFQATRDAAEERLGDAHAAAALAGGGDAERSEASRTLKSEVLGSSVVSAPDRLLPQEFAAHFDDMVEVQRHRAVLAIPIEPAAHVRAHLAIARAYLAIAAKEREAALGLINRHSLGMQFAADFEALSDTYQRELTREEQLTRRWSEQAADLLRDERRAAVLAELFRRGAINKSAYAQVCGVALATASKQLAALAARGLLSQTGKGPSTRYVLPP